MRTGYTKERNEEANRWKQFLEDCVKELLLLDAAYHYEIDFPDLPDPFISKHKEDLELGAHWFIESVQLLFYRGEYSSPTISFEIWDDIREELFGFQELSDALSIRMLRQIEVRAEKFRASEAQRCMK